MAAAKKKATTKKKTAKKKTAAKKKKKQSIFTRLPIKNGERDHFALIKMILASPFLIAQSKILRLHSQTEQSASFDPNFFMKKWKGKKPFGKVCNASANPQYSTTYQILSFVPECKIWKG